MALNYLLLQFLDQQLLRNSQTIQLDEAGEVGAGAGGVLAAGSGELWACRPQDADIGAGGWRQPSRVASSPPTPLSPSNSVSTASTFKVLGDQMLMES